MRLKALVTAALIFAGTTAAHADDGGLTQSASSGSVTVSVYIPPIGATLRAVEEGAVGVWSVSGRNNGLLLRLHEDSDGAGYDAISVYSRAEVGVEARWDNGASANAIAPKVDMGGLNKSTYQVPNSTGFVRTLTISGI